MALGARQQLPEIPARARHLPRMRHLPSQRKVQVLLRPRPSRVRRPSGIAAVAGSNPVAAIVQRFPVAPQPAPRRREPPERRAVVRVHSQRPRVAPNGKRPQLRLIKPVARQHHVYRRFPGHGNLGAEVRVRGTLQAQRRPRVVLRIFRGRSHQRRGALSVSPARGEKSRVSQTSLRGPPRAVRGGDGRAGLGRIRDVRGPGFGSHRGRARVTPRGGFQSRFRFPPSLAVRRSLGVPSPHRLRHRQRVPQALLRGAQPSPRLVRLVVRREQPVKPRGSLVIAKRHGQIRGSPHLRFDAVPRVPVVPFGLGDRTGAPPPERLELVLEALSVGDDDGVQRLGAPVHGGKQAQVHELGDEHPVPLDVLVGEVRASSREPDRRRFDPASGRRQPRLETRAPRVRAPNHGLASAVHGQHERPAARADLRLRLLSQRLQVGVRHRRRRRRVVHQHAVRRNVRVRQLCIQQTGRERRRILRQPPVRLRRVLARYVGHHREDDAYRVVDGFVVGELHRAIEPGVVRVQPRRRERLVRGFGGGGGVDVAGAARVLAPPRVFAPGVRDERRNVGWNPRERAGEAGRVRRRPRLERRRRVRVDDVPRRSGALPRVVKPNPKLGQHVRVPALGVETHAERDPPDVAPRPQRVDEGEAAPGEARVHLGRGRDRDDGAVARLHAPAVLGDAAHRAEPTRRAP